jgi:hypothetical protein
MCCTRKAKEQFSILAATQTVIISLPPNLLYKPLESHSRQIEFDWLANKKTVDFQKSIHFYIKKQEDVSIRIR